MSQVADYYQNINQNLLNLCPKANKILEFGCGAGAFLKAYKDRFPEAHCTGFEKFPDAAKIAQKNCDHIVTGDAENEQDLSHFNAQSFDLIVYGDVLEHFVDPWRAIKLHSQFLSSGGHICICIPNISHWSIIFNLLNGQFTYTDSGLLDRTHLRFFTKDSIPSLCEGLPLKIESIHSIILNTEKTKEAIEKIARIFNQPASELPKKRQIDWSTFQYLVKIRKL